jgi:hypothetical protein
MVRPLTLNAEVVSRQARMEFGMMLRDQRGQPITGKLRQPELAGGTDNFPLSFLPGFFPAAQLTA